MIYTNELNEILNDLKQETNPGKTISAVDVVLRIMKKYYSEEFVEDLNLTVFIKKYFEDRNKFNSLIDDLITLQGNFESEKTDSIMDSSLVSSLKLAEEEAIARPQSPLITLSSFHMLLGALRGCSPIEEVLKHS